MTARAAQRTVAATLADAADMTDARTSAARAICKTIVPVEVVEDAELPLLGEPLYVTDGSAKYRGMRTCQLSSAEKNGLFVGVVFHNQPRQTMAHRGIALIAVTTDGYTYVRREGIPGSAYLPGVNDNTNCTFDMDSQRQVAGVYVKPRGVVLKYTFMPIPSGSTP